MILFAVFSFYFLIIFSCELSEKIDEIILNNKSNLLINILIIVSPIVHIEIYTLFTWLFDSFKYKYILIKIDDRLAILLYIFTFLYFIGLVLNKKFNEKHLLPIILFLSILISIIFNGIYDATIFAEYFDTLGINDYFYVVVVCYLIGTIIRKCNINNYLIIFIKSLYFSVTFISITTLVYLLFIHFNNLVIFFNENNYLFIGEYNNPNAAGIYYSISILLYLFFILTNKQINVFEVLTVLINFYVFSLLNSRASMTSFLMGFVIFVYFYMRRCNKNVTISLTSAVIFLIFALMIKKFSFLSFNYVCKLIGNNAYNISERSFVSNGHDMLSGRLKLWIEAIKCYFSDIKIMIFGQTRIKSKYTHNQLLQLMVSWGIVSLLSFLSICIMSFMEMIQNIIKKDYPHAFVAIIFFTIVANNMTEALLLMHNFPPSILFFVITGYVAEEKIIIRLDLKMFKKN